MSNARWVEMPALQFAGMLVGGGVSTRTPKSIAAVADTDEILAMVNTDGDSGQWTAVLVTQQAPTLGGPSHNSKHGLFISEAGAKARVELWLSQQYTFPAASKTTTWTGVGP